MDDIKVLFSAEEIAERVAGLGRELSDYYRGKEVLVVGVLNGCFVFAADLIRAMTVEDIEIRFIRAKSYIGTQSGGEVDFSSACESIDFKDRNVLIIEDIIDTGNTLAELKKRIMSEDPVDLKIAVFLDKPSRRIADISPDFCCFEIPDRFVVGYGLDYNEKYRQLPYLGAIE
ncbi:hypoxanthine phosphoribosyltransferase [Ruminococcus sp. Marseille-P6503]|uniref:hypoxanthine phosphoribosyltransferase n=1 Tax=Ruminococcus sp. Marseille-P6503 TaxID=2364796 RepID=UPI000F532F5C|nr:hypoxanthine phosphoribosyltransferase [Ruminococcus sp. Marseille-P6503]